MKQLTAVITVLLAALLVWGCTPAQDDSRKTESEKTVLQHDSVYVFDEVSEDTSVAIEEPIVIQPAAADTVTGIDETPPVEEQLKKGFCVQIGAFSTRERAQEFAALAENKLKRKCRVLFRQDINLHAVQLPLVATKEAADRMKSEVKKVKEYKDAFVVEVR